MSNKKLAGVLGSCIALIIAIIVIATLGPGPVTDYSSLLRYLRDSGAFIEEKGETHGFFDIEGRGIAINEATIAVYEYDNAEAMEAEASCISPNGRQFTKENGITLVDWIAPPHFYKAGRIIVFYCGRDDSIIRLVKNALGRQFAGG